MADAVLDQAHGLRRMFQAARSRVIHVVAGRADVGRTAVATNLAMALAAGGRSTLLLECVASENDAQVIAMLDVAARAEAHSAVVARPHGLAVAKAVIPAHAEGGDSRRSRIEIDSLLAGDGDAPEFVLVTSPAEIANEMLVADHEQRDVIVVLSKASSSITEAYALIKRMCAKAGQRTYYILVNAVRSDAEALLIYRNMQAVARGYLDVELHLMGFIPAPRPGASNCAPDRVATAIASSRNSLTPYRRLAEDIARWTKMLPDGGPLASPYRAAASVI